MKTNFEIKSEIDWAIKKHPVLRNLTSRVDIFVSGGVIALVGSLENEQQRNEFIELFSGYPYMKVLTNVSIDPDMAETETDSKLRATIKQILNRTIINHESIKVQVSRGKVYLEGKVFSESDRSIVNRVISKIFGVTGICNNLTFPRVSAR